MGSAHQTLKARLKQLETWPERLKSDWIVRKRGFDAVEMQSVRVYEAFHERRPVGSHRQMLSI